MGEMIYHALGSYYNALEMKGYMPYKDSVKLLLLIFYHDFVFNDYRGMLSKEDYYAIEKALDCLYGSTCLIPYPDYLKMGKLYLGQMTELAYQVKQFNNAEVVKLDHDSEPEGDIRINVE